MKRYWRHITLLMLAVVCFLLIICDSEMIDVFIAAKLLALVLGYITCVLYRYWRKKGQVSEKDFDISERYK